MGEEKKLIVGLAIGIAVMSVFAGVSYFKWQLVEDDYDELAGTYEETVKSLEEKYSHLQSNYTYLDERYRTLQSDYENLQTEYNEYKNLVDMRKPSGSEKCNFITPDDSDVISQTSSLLGSHYDGDLSSHEIDEINDWVYNHIDYNYDIYVGEKGDIGEECWQYPNETLDLGHGDCEDQALLVVSMCLSQENVGWLYCAEIQLTKGSETMDHVCVFADIEGDRLHIFDPTARNTDFPYDGGWRNTESRPESSALDEYRKENGFDSIRVKSVFNQDVYKTFSSNDDFYSWF